MLKGATATPWAGRLLADCIRDAGLPPARVVRDHLSGHGEEVGSTLISHPLAAGATFTGSHEVGMRIAQALQAPPVPRPCIAEMGGKNACIVTAAADLERAASGIVRSAFGMGGQKCSALSRLYVHREIADAAAREAAAADRRDPYRRPDPSRALARSRDDALRL